MSHDYHHKGIVLGNLFLLLIPNRCDVSVSWSYKIFIFIIFKEGKSTVICWACLVFSCFVTFRVMEYIV